jgi:D-alanyl-D-alanine carboxypeptidase
MRKLLQFILFNVYALYTAAQVEPQLATRLQTSLDSVCALYKIKGATAAVLLPGQGIWEGTYGVSQPNVAVTKQMAFGMGSNTKTYVAALMLKLQSKGIVDLDDTIGKWIQGYVNIPGNATIRQCLNHTSGIAEYLGAAVNDSLLGNPSKIWTLSEVLLMAPAPDFAPGTSWKYSNTGYVIAGIIIEEVTNKTFVQAMRDYLLDSAGYSNTFFYGETNNAPLPGQWTMNLTGTSMVEMNTFSINIVPQLFSLANTAGAMMSTAKDNVQFWYDLVKGNLITRDEFNEMIQLRNIATNTEYGLGIFRYNRRINNRTIYSHGGTFLGFINENAIDTFSGVAISVMTNQDSISNARLLTSFIPALHRHTLSFPYLNVSTAVAKLYVDVYPNPASEKVYITTKNVQHSLHYRLFTPDGKLHYEGDVNQQSIDVSNMPKGLYLLQLTDTETGAVSHKKVMLQ